MATIQFDRIYHGVTAEVGSELSCIKFEKMNIDDEVLCRISSSSERNGVEGRRIGRSYCHGFDRYQVGPMDACGSWFSASCRDERPQTRKIRGFLERGTNDFYSGVQVLTFIRQDHDKLTNLLKTHFAITLETREVAVKGWNWGVIDFQGNFNDFYYDLCRRWCI